MNINYTKIDPAGNISLIVKTPVERSEQSRVAAQLMQLDKEAEQVGFLEHPSDSRCAARLQMMGGEFCGNASLSCAAVLMNGKSGKCDIMLEVSGAPDAVKVQGAMVSENEFDGTVSMPLPEAIYECTLLDGFEEHTFPVVRFTGISHAIVAPEELSKGDAERLIGKWCASLGAQALGLMFFDAEKMSLEPLVYVKNTDTAVWEGSCASGTAAVAAYLAEIDGEMADISLTEPRGEISASALCSGSEVSALSISGSAVIRGDNNVSLIF